MYMGLPRRGLCLLLTCLSVGGWAATVQVTVLGRDGQPLSDAVVILEGTASTPAKPLPVQATISQQKMQFVPMVSVVPVGSRVRFTNLDSWDHHVRGLPVAPGMAAGDAAAPAPGFELRLAGKADGREAHSADVTLDKPGPLQLGCHLHGSMRGFVVVTDSPWAAKTDATGVVSFRDVPEGAARLRVWHADQLVDLPVTAVQIMPVTALSVPTPVQPRRRRS
jgi:plastocyanin